MKAKSFKIETFEDMLNCTNEDNLDMFLSDLKGAIQSYHMIRDTARLSVKNYNSSKIKTSGYTWIDDGKNEINIELRSKKHS